ncbi:MAG: hypothetical protein K2H82_07945 [Oscillospiraceae bacterium]|nr:hypothetical protein [Oscillospiraceae bacterium]
MLKKTSIIPLIAAGTIVVTMTGCGQKTDSNSEPEPTFTETIITEKPKESTIEMATEPITEAETETEPATEPETTEPVDEKDEELVFFDELIQKTIAAYQNKEPEEYLKCTTDEINLYMLKDNPTLVQYGVDYSTHEKIVEDVTVSINENRFVDIPCYYFLGDDFTSEFVVNKHDIKADLPDLLYTYFTTSYTDTDYVASGQVFEDYNFEDVVIVYGTFTGTDGTPKPRHIYIAKVNGEWLVDPAFFAPLEAKEEIGLTEEMLGANKYERGSDGHYIIK